MMLLIPLPTVLSSDMAYQRPAPEPKFKKGDLVKETKHIALQVNFNPREYKRLERGIGTVIDVIVKKIELVRDIFITVFYGQELKQKAHIVRCVLH